MAKHKRFGALVLLATFAFGCGGKPFNIKTQPPMPPIVTGARAELNAITIQAQMIADEDFLFETFDANLILAGILPVRVKIKNGGHEAIELKRARFEIKQAGSRKFKLLSARKAFERLIGYYEISTYSKDGYKESEADFSSYALDARMPLGAGESREGMLFFLMPGEDVPDMDLTLVVSRLGVKKGDESAELKLKQ